MGTCPTECRFCENRAKSPANSSFPQRISIVSHASEPQKRDPRESVQRLFLQNMTVLEGFVLGLVPDYPAAQDILQEVFLTATQKADEFVPGSNFLAWARTIAKYKVLQHFERRRGEPRPLDPDVMELVASAAFSEGAAGEGDDWLARQQALTACLDQLAPTARHIVELRYGDPPALPQEIAAALNWTANAVRVALTRARRFLEDCTARRLAQGEP